MTALLEGIDFEVRYSVYVNCLLAGLLVSIKLIQGIQPYIILCNVSIMQVELTPKLFGVYGQYHTTYLCIEYGNFFALPWF